VVLLKVEDYEKNKSVFSIDILLATQYRVWFLNLK